MTTGRINQVAIFSHRRGEEWEGGEEKVEEEESQRVKTGKGQDSVSPNPTTQLQLLQTPFLLLFPLPPLSAVHPNDALKSEFPRAPSGVFHKKKVFFSRAQLVSLCVLCIHSH